MLKMNEELIRRAVALGINVSLYWLLPPDRREDAIRKDVERAEKSAHDDE